MRKLMLKTVKWFSQDPTTSIWRKLGWGPTLSEVRISFQSHFGVNRNWLALIKLRSENCSPRASENGWLLSFLVKRAHIIQLYWPTVTFFAHIYFSARIFFLINMEMKNEAQNYPVQYSWDSWKWVFLRQEKYNMKKNLNLYNGLGGRKWEILNLKEDLQRSLS